GGGGGAGRGFFPGGLPAAPGGGAGAPAGAALYAAAGSRTRSSGSLAEGAPPAGAVPQPFQACTHGGSGCQEQALALGGSHGRADDRRHAMIATLAVAGAALAWLGAATLLLSDDRRGLAGGAARLGAGAGPFPFPPGRWRPGRAPVAPWA